MTRKNNFFEGCFWFKFSNLELAPGVAFQLYTRIEMKSQKVSWASSYICRNWRSKRKRVRELNRIETLMNSAVGKTDIYQCKIRDTKQEFKIKVELKKLDKEAPRLANFPSFHILFFFWKRTPVSIHRHPQ